MSRLLKKSFDPAKCKTLLQLAAQKLKILRNKHAIAVKTLRADVARLLENGQDSSAKTQVDNVYREEKIVILYNLLEQFCQLVISRLESIKSQRECPPDLKEAVASLIYAAPRCEEIEELKEVSSYLKNKYGTEFSLAAKELRSGCGVNTQVIQNLSSLPLSYDARMKLLKDIAAENNIKWEDATNADTTKHADLLDGPSHFPSGTQVSDGRNLDKQKSASMSMHTNEVNGQAAGVLKISFSSHTQSPKTSLDSRLHNMHQPAQTNSNSTTKGVCSSSKATSSIDPYALARLQGRMDYNFVSDYMQREHKIEEHFDSTASINVAHYDGRLTYPESLNNLHKEQMSNAGTQEVESQLLDLEAATKIALASASEAVEAARDAVAMMRKDSIGSNRSRLPNTKQPAGRFSQSTSVPIHGEVSSADPIGGESSSIRVESRFAPTWDNSDSDMNNHASEDTSEDLLKYVVFEETSDSQRWSSQVQDSATMKGESERLETSNGQKQDGLFTKTEFQQDKTVISSVPQFDDYSSDDLIEEDLPYYPSTNASRKKQHESIFDDLEVQQDKGMQNESSVPQFDDVKSEEASEEEIPFYLKGRAAIVKEDYSDGVARTPSHKLMTTSHLLDGWREESLGLDVQGTEEEPSLHMDSTEEPSNSSISKESLIHSHKHVESVCSPSQSLKTSPRSKFDFISGRSGIESSPPNSRYDKVPSLLSSGNGFPGYEDGDPSRHVRRNLKWGAAISEDSEFGFKKTDEAYEPNPLVEKLSLRSPNSSVDLEERTRPDFEPSTQGIQSSPRKYQGMSRRSLRSTRPRPQDVPSPTT